MVKRLSHVRAAIGDVRRLREEIEKAERPDPRLERDLADAIAHLEAVKAKKKAKSKKKEVKGIRAELIEAEKEADQALKVETEAKRDTREPRRPPTRRDKISSHCEKIPPPRGYWKPPRRDKKRPTSHFFNKECALYATKKQLYEANARVLALQRRLGQHAPDPN